MSIDFPVYVHLFSLRLSAHFIFETLAFIIAYRYYVYLRKGTTDTISSTGRLYIVIGAALGALVGSRLLGALENPCDWAEASNPWIYLYISKTIVGGLLFGLWGVELMKLAIGEKSSSGDLFTFPLILGMMIGRVGCFLNGVYEPTFGNETSFILGMNLGDGVLRHPVALYEIAFLALLWWGLRMLQKHVRLQSGDLFKLFMIFYFSFRFFVDFIKPTYLHPYVGLSTIQLACIVCLIYYAKSIYRFIHALYRRLAA